MIKHALDQRQRVLLSHQLLLRLALFSGDSVAASAALMLQLLVGVCLLQAASLLL